MCLAVLYTTADGVGLAGGGGIPPVGISGEMFNLFNRRQSAIRLLPLITVILRYAAACNIARLPRRSVTKTGECGELRHTAWWLTGRNVLGWLAADLFR